MKNSIIIILLVSVAMTLYGQTEPFYSAGPDITICSGNGKELGHPTVFPLSKYCYRWEPAVGLSNPDDAKPIASPQKTTTYTLTVLSENWDLIGTDQVTVHVGWGGIKFDPTYLFQSGESMTTPTLEINEIGGLPHWTIEGADLNCQLPNHGTGVITDGNKFGTITVRCEDILQPSGECYAEEKLEINPGVKDVQAFDFNNPERVAKNGETLVLIEDYGARIKAVANEGGFPDGYPKWSPSINSPIPTTVPSDGEEIFVRTGSLDEEFIAGPGPDHAPRVYIDRRIYTDDPFVVDPIIQSLVSSFENFSDNVEVALGKCGSMELSVNENLLTYNRIDVEKYADPGVAVKHEVVFSPSVSFTGKACHCALTQCLEWPFTGEKLFGSELCLFGGITVGMEGNAVYDPSEKDAKWKYLENFKFKGGLEFGVVGGLEILLPGAYTISPEITASVKPVAELNFDLLSGIVSTEFKIEPLTLTVVFEVTNNIDPPETHTYFNKSYRIVPEQSLGPYSIFTFGQ